MNKIAMSLIGRCMAVAVVVVLIAAAPVAALESPVTATAALGSSVVLADKAGALYLKVNLRGNAPDRPEKRTPVNIALVIDKSGSMQGEKIERAKEAAIMALGRLSAEDIVSVVTYDDSVTVVVPATRATDKESLYAQISGIHANGSTALFAGVSKAAAEVRKFRAEKRANRIVLLSDGLANVGPSSPAELAELGTSLATEQISVSTIGLGLDYNEDLMVRLASSGGGNHIFAENATDLARAYDREFGDLLSVVAQEVEITVECPPAVRLVRVLGYTGVVQGQIARIVIPQVYAEQDKYVVFELETPALPAGNHARVADVRVKCTKSDPAIEHGFQVLLDWSASAEAVEASVNADVMASVARQIGAERMLQAQALRDAGKVEEARTLFTDNGTFLKEQGERYNNEYLKKDALSNESIVQGLESDEAWRMKRKQNLFESNAIQKQGLGYKN